MPRDPYAHLMQGPPTGAPARPATGRAERPSADAAAADPAELIGALSEALSSGLARHNRDMLRLLAPLGEGLRDALHPLGAAAPGLGAAPARDGPADLEARVARLERLLRERPAAGSAPSPAATIPTPAHAPAAAVPQDTLRLQCRARGRTAGKVRLVNPLTRPARIVAVAAAALDAEGRPVPGVRVALREAQPTIEAGAARVLGVEVDLSDAPARPGRLETALDLALDGQPSLRLWIEVDVHDDA